MKNINMSQNITVYFTVIYLKKNTCFIDGEEVIHMNIDIREA